MWDHSKGKAFISPPQTLEDLRQRIIGNVNTLRDERQKLISSIKQMRKRTHLVIDNNGGHVEGEF